MACPSRHATKGPSLPRLRALLVSTLVIGNEAACTSWQLPWVTPQQYVTQYPDTKVRVTAKDEQGSLQSSVVLKEVRFSEDSVFGRDLEGQPVAFSLQEVAWIEVREKDGFLTGWLVVVLVPVTLLLLVAISIWGQ